MTSDRTTYVYLRSPAGELVSVAPGEELPSWARPRQEPSVEEVKPKPATRGRPKRATKTEE